MINIDRCLCHDRTFASLKEISDSHGVSDLETLQKIVPFGNNCQLCHPYVRVMLRSGQVVFNQVLTDSALEEIDVDVDIKPKEEID